MTSPIRAALMITVVMVFGLFWSAWYYLLGRRHHA